MDKSLSVTWSAKDGDRISTGTEFGRVQGSAVAILTAERVALNLMQRMSGIATATAAMVAAVQARYSHSCACMQARHGFAPCRSATLCSTQGSRSRILDTRKTMPGLRVLDKWAVLIGGGVNHRMGLYDMLMIKDNHIAAAGGIAAAVERAQVFLLQC